jgi:hypothetical protein
VGCQDAVEAGLRKAIEYAPFDEGTRVLVARLKNELDLSRISIENHRSREEQLSEENKRLVPDNMNLDTLIRRAGQYSNTIE